MNKYLLPSLMVLIAFGLVLSHFGFFDQNLDSPNTNSKLALNGNSIIEENQDTQTVYVTVNGPYYEFEPKQIKAGVPTKIISDKSMQGCSMFMLQRELGVNANFMGNNEYTFTPNKKGRFKFSCSMGMYNGYLEII